MCTGSFAIASAFFGAAILIGPTTMGARNRASETSGYYLLGVEPQGLDRNGRPRQLQVHVRGDVTVRSWQWVVVSPPKVSR